MAGSNTGEVWSRISAQFPDINEKIANFQFPGRGQRVTPVADTPTLVEIAWLCPGRAAKEFRRKGAITLCRALGGDLTLVDEIETRHRAISGTEEQQTLLAGTGVSVARANHSEILRDVVMGEEYALWQDPRYVAQKTLGCVELARSLLERFDGLDAPMRDCLRDLTKNSMLQLTGAAGGAGPVSSPVTWGVVMRAQSLGYSVRKEDWSLLGRLARQQYERVTGRVPSMGKKPAFAGDSGVAVWHYTEKECRDIVDGVIRDYFAGKNRRIL